MDSTEIKYDPVMTLQHQTTRPKFIDFFLNTSAFTEQPDYQTTKSPVDNGGNSGLADSYKMAALVSVIAAIIVALTILLALILKAIKRRLPDSANSGASSSTSRRYSTDSFDRLVEDRLRNRPPPYSPDQDKPPSYEESFHDSSNYHRSPTSRRRSRDRRRNNQRETSRRPSLELPRVHETNRYPWFARSAAPIGHESSTAPPLQSIQASLPSNSTAIRIVSYDNRAFVAEEPARQQSTVDDDIPSISMAVYENEREMSSGCQDDDNEEGVVMLHL